MSRRERSRRFRRLLEEDGDALWRLTGTYARTRADREDLYQDICLAVWEALPRFRGEASARTYVFRIAHNRGLSHREARGPAPREPEEAEAVADPKADPGAGVEDDRLSRLRAAVRDLPLSYRQVVTLRLEGLSYAEIAEVVGISENNVGVRLHRARNALKSKLGLSGGS